MGILSLQGKNILNTSSVPCDQTDRDALILGTGWSNPNVLKEQGFELDKIIAFNQVGIDVESGAGHKNRFLLGAWHEKNVVISQGRIHLYQETGRQNLSLIRRWMAVLMALMGKHGLRIIITSSVGSLNKSVRKGMLVQPTGIVSAHLPMPYLVADRGEYVMSEHLLWIKHKESETDRIINRDVFNKAIFISGFKGWSSLNHYVIQGPGFGGATERRLWASWGCDTVGMSLDPELRLTAVENMTNRDKGDCAEKRVFVTCYVTDDHDLPDNEKIQAEAEKKAPQLGKFLSEVLKSDW